MNKQNKPDFEILDCLRGIAALYVVINHCRGNLFIGGSELAEIIPVSDWGFLTKLHYAVLRFTSLGSEFVVVFFVLSGFSIAYSLRNQQNIFRFYLKRLVRLYPPFIIALIWAALVFKYILLIEPSFNHNLTSVFSSWKSTVLNLMYISNGAYISQFWSLVHEVIFYLLAPLVFLNRKGYYIISTIFYLISWLISWNNISGTTIIYRFILDYNFYFVIGVWLYYNYKLIENLFSVGKYRTLLFSCVVISIMVFIKYVISDYNKITPFLASILSVFWIVNFQRNNIKARWLLVIGAMSYTLYISHFATIKLFNILLIKFNYVELGLKITNPVMWIFGVLFCIGISYLFYIIAEKPTKTILVKLREI